MQITIDSSTITPEEYRALGIMLNVLDADEGGTDEAPARPAKKAPAKKAPAKRAAAKPAPEADEDDEAEDEDGPTLEDAVARAQELVGEKRTAEVKAAIAEIGVERVSKLRGAQIAEFLELVKDDDSVV